MDVVVSKAPEGPDFILTDLLGRPMGRIVSKSVKLFVIEPAGEAVSTMSGMVVQHHSLDAALTQIETHTRGACRRNWETTCGEP